MTSNTTDPTPETFEQALKWATHRVVQETYLLAVDIEEQDTDPTLVFPPSAAIVGASTTKYGVWATALCFLADPNHPRKLDIHHIRSFADDLTSLLLSKRADYGDAALLLHGLAGIRIRLDDKIFRYLNLMSNGKQPEHETVKDTLIDMCGYTVLAHMFEQSWFRLPTSNPAIKAPSVTVEDGSHVGVLTMLANTFGYKHIQEGDWVAYRNIEAAITI